MRRAFVVYAAAAAIYTWPLVLHPVSRLAAPVGPGDPYLNLWILGWGMDAILHAPLDVLTGRVFNANIFHPAASTLAYSDHLLLQAAALAPLYALTGSVVLCYNVLLVASLVFGGVAMHAFARAVTGSTGGAYLAGLAWAFWPYRFAHLPHVQLQALYFLPLAFLFLHRLMAGRRARDAVLLGVVAGLQALSSVYYAVIGAVGLALGAVLLAVGVGRPRSSLVARHLALAAATGALLVAPVALVYWQLQADEGFGRGLYQAARNAATLDSYARVPAENLLYGRTGLLPAGMLERALFPGLVVLVLGVFGGVRGWRGDARPLAMTMAGVGLLGFVLSLGPDGVRDLYAAFQRFVFGFQAIRAPARFSVLVTFALATLSALGWRELAGGRSGRRLALALLCLAAVEYLNVPLPLAAAPPRQTPVGQWLRQAPGGGAVVHLPIGLDVESTPAMVQSLEHRRPLVNGYSGQRPAFYTALVDSLSTFPDDEALLALREAGVRFVVSAAPAAIDSAAASPLVERARFPGAVIYELQWTPAIDERLAANLAVTPPPPGPPPFAAGEEARYDAYWEGAGVDVPAGEVTVSVAAPFTFVARGRTAPWMAHFFEAEDTFTTRTDAQLLPTVHERELREGSRHVRRTFLYRHAERVVRIGRDAAQAAGDTGVSLPLAAAARDAIAAVFFARTLPLATGDRYLIPINEAGRNLVVELVVEGRETIVVQDRQVPAIRLDPRVRRRLERRTPATATLWLSDDPRKVPLALDLDAPFGHVRLELSRYHP